ncbi:MAG TPA: ABC transporter permease subunit [Acidimicrobiales bacterium]|nr:ABC transporter permease subunit [Acidimicrobiales bacterium]
MALDADVRARIAGLDALAQADLSRPSRRTNLWRALWPKFVAVVVVIALWQIAVWSHHWRPYVLYGPGPTLSYLARLLTTSAFWSSLGVTARRAVEGFVIAMLVGSVLGIATARSWVVRSAISSLLTGLQSMPTIVWPLFGAMLLGLSDGAIILVVVLGTSPFVARAMLSGLDQVQPILVRAGRTLGARRLTLVRHVILPAALPSVVTAFQQGWAFTWRTLMTAEVLIPVAGRLGIGTRLDDAYSQQFFQVMLAYMIVILLVGIVVDSLFQRADHVVRDRWGLLAGSGTQGGG